MPPSRTTRRHSQLTRGWIKLACGLVGGLLIVAGAALWLNGGRRTTSRAAGLTAARDGRDVEAVKILGAALQKQPLDPEGWLSYARVRERVLAPDQAHLAQAQTAWKRAVDQNPDSAVIWAEYARFATVMADWQGTIKAARKSWEMNPDDAESGHLWASALLATRNEPESRAALDQVRARHPDDWRLLVDQLLVDQTAGISYEPLRESLRKRTAQPGADPRWLGVLALATRMSQSREASEPEFRNAAELAPADPDYLRWLVPVLDEIGAPDAIVPLLEQRSQVLTDGRLQLVFARRAWEGGRPDLILSKLPVRTLSLAIDPELVALRCLALRAVEGEATALTEVANLLKSPPQTIAETAYRPALRILVTSDTCDPQSGVQALTEALRVTGASPILHFALAECWFRLQEFRLAAQASVQCARFAPYWQAPRAMETAAYIRAGLPDEAYNAAFRAFSLQPNSPESALAFATAWLMAAEPGPAVGAGTLHGLIAWLRDIFGKMPVDRQDGVRLLLIQALLKQGDLTGAEQAVQEVAAARDSQLPGTAELKLIQAQIERARRQAEAVAAGEPQPEPAAAEVPSAGDVPGDAARGAPPPLANATAWRLVRARELLTGDRTEKSAAQAAALLRPVLEQLPNHPDAHLLAGVAMARLSDRRKAADHLLRAVEGDWRRSAESMRLGLALRAEGFWEDAADLVRLWSTATQISERLAFERRFQRKRGEDPSDVEDPDALNDSVIIRLLVLAEIAEQMSDANLAEATYLELLQLDPDQPAILNNLSMLLLNRTEQQEEALRLARRAVELEPRNEAYLDTLAQVTASIDRSNGESGEASSNSTEGVENKQ